MTVALLFKEILPVVVKPIVFTVPIAKPLFSTKEILPVLHAKGVIALLVFVKVYVAPEPNNSRPAALIDPLAP